MFFFAKKRLGVQFFSAATAQCRECTDFFFQKERRIQEAVLSSENVKNNAQCCKSLSCRERKKKENSCWCQTHSQYCQRAFRQPQQVHPWAYTITARLHTCHLNNKMLDYFLLLILEDTQSLQRLIVQTQFLSKLQFNPKNCVWTSVAADSHSSLLSLAKRHIKNVGLQNHKGVYREAFSLILFCNCFIFR